MTDARKKRKLTGNVQFKFVVSFFVIIAALLVLLNTYPMMTSRDLVFAEKQSSLMSRASVISASLSALDTFTESTVTQVMDLLDISGLSRIVVTDESGRILYDTAQERQTGKFALFSEIARALDGECVFWSRFAEGAFLSRAAIPIRSRAVSVGAVYLCEYDTERAQLLTGIQSQMRSISVVACAIAIVLTLIFSKNLTERINKLSNAMQRVQDGDYAYRLEVTGDDELSVLGRDFNSLTQRLENTEQQRRRFVSDASHELKTPLASIRLLSDSIVQSADMDSGTMREFVTDIGSEAERLQRTTEKLLNLSRRDDGMQFERSPVDLVDAARATLRLLTPLAQARRVSIECSFEDGCVVPASEDDLYQIVFNLVENAIKYNVEGGSVRLSAFGDADRIILLVEDTGIGIPEADRDNIFSRFYRVDKARSREAGGSGLGLSIVHDAVEALGGEISVRPRSPEGSVFEVAFPRWEETEAGEQ